MNEDFVADIEEKILAYLAAHPDAADNPVGIQRWWLPRQLAYGPLRCVEVALANLAARGAIVEIRLPDGSVMFGAVSPARRKS